MYDTDEEIERLVRAFESCTIAAADFHHREHLVVTVWYLQTLSRDETLDAMRAGLLRFIDHHGVDPKKYSEETTVYWIREIARLLEEINAGASLPEKCKAVTDAFSSTARKPTAPVAAVE